MKRQLTFDRKMIRFISAALIISASVIILASVVSTVLSITIKSEQMAQRDAQVVSAGLEDNFNQYRSLIWALAMDNDIQAYMSMEGARFEYIDDVSAVLENAILTREDINFISVIRGADGMDVTKGKSIPNRIVGYVKYLEESFDNSIEMSPNSAMRLQYSDEYGVGGEYSLNVFFPLYAPKLNSRRLGIMCVNINDADLARFVENGASANAGADGSFATETYLVYKDGTIIACGDTSQIGTPYADSVSGRAITYSVKNVTIQKKLARWDFTYITRIPWRELLNGVGLTVLLLVGVLCLLIALYMRLAKRMVLKAYEPWGAVVRAMGSVSSGKLEARLSPTEDAPDMRIVSSGFNGMMKQIVKLMEQVKEEQFQMDQLRMDALQAQIQPHFLYNTLDCIHWQAVGAGNRDISEMVKALASYYRICLSKGRDIVTVREELEYLRNYLYIQKIRYIDVLSYEIAIDPELCDGVLPKLSLQPLVENAIYHGVKKLEDRAGHIRVAVYQSDTAAAQETGATQLPETADSCGEKLIRIDVSDNGIGMSDDEIRNINLLISSDEGEFGYGVRNVNRRIKLYFGQEYGLVYRKNEDGGVTVNLTIPARGDPDGKRAATRMESARLSG